MNFLGSSGLQVSALSFGAMTFGGTDPYFGKIGSQQLSEARELVSVAIDHGVNLFDTADFYSEGQSEEILGQSLRKRRSEALIATKLRYPMSSTQNDSGLSRHHILEACVASLRRLDTDHIDVLYLHNIDTATPLEETMRALDDLVRAGKVRYLGVSNFPAWMVTKAAAVSSARGWERFVCNQVHYSLACRDIESELVPSALDAGVGHTIWSPLSGGLLSGKYRRDNQNPENTRRSRGFGDTVPVDDDKILDIVDVATDIAGSRGTSVAQVALNWVVSRPTVSSVIVGARTREQLLDNLGATAWELTTEEIDRLDAASEPRLPYPQWHNRIHSQDRRRGPGDRVLAGRESPGRRAQRLASGS
ncbi:aldo/keto reductase [Gordonia terrae]